jgi:hypothetical protein
LDDFAVAFDAEKVFHPALERPRELKRHGRGGGVPIGFHGGNRLASDARHIAELFLRQTRGLAFLTQSIFEPGLGGLSMERHDT